MYILQNDYHNKLLTSITSQKFFLMMQAFKNRTIIQLVATCFISNFQIHSTVLLTIVTCHILHPKDFPGGSEGKESACNVGDLGSIPGSGRSPEGGHGNPLQYFCLENPHGQRSLGSYSPQGCTEQDITEVTQYMHTVRFEVG